MRFDLRASKMLRNVLGAKKYDEFVSLVDRYEKAKAYDDEMRKNGFVSAYLSPVELNLIECCRKFDIDCEYLTSYIVINFASD